MIALPNTPARLLLGRRIVALLLLGLFLAPLPAAAGDRELDEAVSDRDTRAIARRMGELAREDPARALRLVPLAYARVEKAPWESFYVADRYAVFTAALRALRQACSPTATDILKGALVNSREWPVRFLILEASLQISSLDSVDLSLRAIKDPVPQVSAVAARILGRSKEIVALAPLLVALKRWESPARREKVARGGRKALAADEAGKAWLACRDALHRLTGVSLHNHLAYKSYIRAHREEIDPKKVDVSKPKEEKTGVGLFGLDVTGRNIIFILDISGSMESTDPLTPKQLEKLNRPRTGVAGAGDELEKKLLAERRRIRRAKRELTSVVKS
ncbi:MAG: HEAT repeat domain-containing protein, partial [Planctomycetota bacterium]